jgi:hypothetical protein
MAEIIIGYTNVEPQPLSTATTNNDLRDVRQLQVGFGSKVLRIDRDGLWMGAETFAAAPFSVDMLGNMVATSLDLSGYLQVGDALTDIGAGNITGTYIASGAITTAKLSATAIDGMTITGALIRTSSSGGRVVMDDATDSLRVYDISGNERMRLDEDELTFYNASEVLMGTIYTGSNYMAMDTDTGATLGIVFFAQGVQKAAITTAGLNLNDDLIAATSGIDIGSSAQPFEDLFVDDIRPTAQSTNPTIDGMMRYYVSGGTEGLRMQFGGSDFQFDATGV